MNSSSIIINIPSQEGNPAIELLSILLPSILTPVIGLCSWIIRGYYDRRDKMAEQHRDKKRKYLITSLSNKLKVFYWPLYLNLIRYRQLLNKYNDFRDGKFSLDRSLTSYLQPSKTFDAVAMDDVKVNFHEETPLPNVSIHITDADGEDTKSEEKNIKPVRRMSISSEEKNIKPVRRMSTSPIELARIFGEIGHHIASQSGPTGVVSDTSGAGGGGGGGGGIGLAGAIRVIDRFNRATGEYETKMMEMLRVIQEIYTTNTPIVEPSSELLGELVKLDQYINYMTTFKKLSDDNPSDSIIEEKMSNATFPVNIIRIIEEQLKQHQIMYNDVINNYNSPVIDTS